MEGTLNIRELSDWMLLGENKDRIRKKIKVESNKKGKVSIRLESKLKDVKILGLDNKEKSEIKANEEICFHNNSYLVPAIASANNSGAAQR